MHPYLIMQSMKGMIGGQKNVFICSRGTLCLQKVIAGATHLIPESAPIIILYGLHDALEKEKKSINLLFRPNNLF